MQLIAEKTVGVLGRVVIPEEIRKTMGLEDGAKIAIFRNGSELVIRSMDPKFLQPSCVACNNIPAEVLLANHCHLCRRCARKAANHP